MACCPAASFAQAAIAGTARDVSGAPMRGVLVEASSPALIEKVRTVVTDGAGQYRIEDLRPGIYAVTFSLPGWSPSTQSGVELTGTLTATVNATLMVGPLEETINVTGVTPVVDVYSAKREVTLTGRGRAVDSHGPQLQRPARARAGRDHQCERHGHGHRDDVVPGSRRPDERRTAVARRIERRQSAQWEFSRQLRRRRGQRPGGDVHDHGWPGRGGNRRAGDEHRAQDRRQRDGDVVFRRRHRRKTCNRTT